MWWVRFERYATRTNVIVAILVLIYLIGPVVVVFPLAASSERFFVFPPPALSWQWYQNLWANPGYLHSFTNTIIVGGAVALFGTALGTMAALAVVRGRIIGRHFFSAALMSPIVLPHIVLAIGVFPIFAYLGLIGSLWGVVLVHTSLAIPLVFATVSASLRGYSENLELAAMTLGADTLRTFVYVTWPMIRPGVIVGAIFAFASSFDEVVVALFVTDAASVTLPVFLWNELFSNMDPTIAAASTLAILFSTGLLGVVALLQRRRHPATQK